MVWDLSNKTIPKLWSKIAKIAAEHGQIKTVEYILKNHNIEIPFKEACKSGNIELIKMLENYAQKEDLFTGFLAGPVNVFHYLENKTEFQIINHSVFIRKCGTFGEFYGYLPSESLLGAIENENWKLFDRLKYECNIQHLLQCAYNGRIEMLEQLLEIKKIPIKKLFFEAIRGGQIHMIRWLEKKEICYWYLWEDRYELITLAGRTNVETFTYVTKRLFYCDAKVDDSCLIRATKKGNVDLVLLLLNWMESYDILPNVMRLAIKLRHVELVKIFKAYYIFFFARDKKNLLLYSLKKMSLDIYQLLDKDSSVGGLCLS